MSLSKTENWDSVTAPAIPSGWNVSNAAVVTETLQKYSGANALGLNSGGAGTKYYCTYGTDDGSSTNSTAVTVIGTAQILFGVVGPGSYKTGLHFRGSASTLDNSSTSTYVAYIDSDNTGAATFNLAKIVSGTLTTLGSAVTIPTNMNGGWYSITASGTFGGGANSFSLYLQRISDSYYLTSGGAWAAPMAAAITSSNYDLTTGPYHGTFLSSQSGANVYSDDWSLASYGAATVPRPGANIHLVRLPAQYWTEDFR